MQSRFKSWPNGTRIAIAITPMFEVWPEGKGPANLVQRTQVKPGIVDRQALTWPHYAGKEGVWRIIRIIDRHGVPGTFCTNDFLAQEKVLWQGDANYIDLPRRVKTKHGTLVHIPHSDYTDNRVVWLSPRQYYDVYKDTFDYLYANEPMALMVMTVHSHFGGRPLMAAVFDKLLTYFAQFPDVWFARHRELAQWALDSGSDEVTYAQRFFA